MKAKCNHCRAKLAVSSTNENSRLDRHLKRRKAKGVPSVSNSLQKTLIVMRKDDKITCVETREFDLIVAWQKIAIFVVKHLILWGVMHYWMSYTNSLVKNLSRTTLKSKILKLYEAKKAKAMALLENNDSRMAITIDMWLLQDKS